MTRRASPRRCRTLMFMAIAGAFPLQATLAQEAPAARAALPSRPHKMASASTS